MAEHRLGETHGTRDFERRDVRSRPVLLAAVAMAVVVVLASVGAGPFITWLTREPPAAPIVPGLLEREGPPLLTNPEDRLTELQRENEDRLTGTDWVDREAGIARIPITDAMDILAERGWSAPPPQSPPRRMMPLPSRRDAPAAENTEASP